MKDGDTDYVSRQHGDGYGDGYSSIGALPVKSWFTSMSIAKDYDRLIYVDHTTTSKSLVAPIQSQ